MLYEEIIQIITRWKEEAKKDRGECLKNGQYHAANYINGKELAYENVLELLQTSDKINKPWEE